VDPLTPTADDAPRPDATEPTPPNEPSGPTESTKAFRVAREWIILGVAAVVIALVVRAFLFQAFYIPSESMVPTLEKHDRVLVNKLSYKLHPVHRGDIVVFKAPPGVDKSVKDLVKRVIGIPGDTVEGKADGSVYVNGKKQNEKYVNKEPGSSSGAEFPSQTVPPECYWVMGDNRGVSEDSRFFKCIPKRDIVGRVFIRIWPLNRIDLL
jgi:signal peptidase I